jgi:hypothetical protein
MCESQKMQKGTPAAFQPPVPFFVARKLWGRGAELKSGIAIPGADLKFGDLRLVIT